MTPLALRIMNEKTLPLKQRTFKDGAEIMDKIESAHCFEITKIMSLIESCRWDLYQTASAATNFLPSPHTWIEYKFDDFRVAYLLIEDKEKKLAHVHLIRDDEFAGDEIAKISLYGNPNRYFQIKESVKEQKHFHNLSISILFPILAMINTPRIIGRRQHMPHAGLQRRLAKSKGMVGKFPLQAWTEILLEVTPPKEAKGEHLGILSGSRAFHFVRQHLRIKNGRLELVSAHWRGDPSLGIMRSRYRLIPPKNGLPEPLAIRGFHGPA